MPELCAPLGTNAVLCLEWGAAGLVVGGVRSRRFFLRRKKTVRGGGGDGTERGDGGGGGGSLGLTQAVPHYGGKAKRGTVLACAAVGAFFWLGTASGDILIFSLNRLKHVLGQCHGGSAVAALAAVRGPGGVGGGVGKSKDTPGVDGFLVASGARDGSVHLWRANGEHLQSISCTEGAAGPWDAAGVCALDFRPDDQAGGGGGGGMPTQSLLVGTRRGEVLELQLTGSAGSPCSAAALAVFTESHCDGEAWGLRPHPVDSDVVATAADDNTVRVWDLKQRRLVAMRVIDGNASSIGHRQLGGAATSGAHAANQCCRALAYSLPDGRELAVALNSGHVKVLDTATLRTRHSWRESEEWIADVQYSPDGAALAVGSHDNLVHVYDARRKYTKTATLAGHSSFISHFDWSSCSALLRTNCGGYELLYWEVGCAGDKKLGAARRVLDREQIAAARWSTSSCVLGWDVQNIWPPGADGTDVNAVCRSRDRQSLATGDDFGQVRLLAFPAVRPDSLAQVHTGHASHVANVAFNRASNRLLSLGGDDDCLFVWKVTKPGF